MTGQILPESRSSNQTTQNRKVNGAAHQPKEKNITVNGGFLINPLGKEASLSNRPNGRFLTKKGKKRNLTDFYVLERLALKKRGYG